MYRTPSGVRVAGWRKDEGRLESLPYTGFRKSSALFSNFLRTAHVTACYP
jgi:hypothetical protein